MRQFVILLLVLLSFGVSNLYTQSTIGTEFWLSYMQNFDDPANTQLYITSEFGASGTVSIPGTGWTTNFNIGVNGSQFVNIPSAQNACISQINTPLNRAVKVQSSSPVAVYAANQRTASSDATIVFPNIALGDTYLINTYSTFSSEPSQFIIVGIEDNTSIEIIPKANLNGGGGNANVPFTITLNTGQVYFVQSMGDLTGSSVKAVDIGNCHNFAVFAGNRCANVPLNCTYCDHLYEQMIPIKAWGNNYIAVPLMTRNNATYRILASEDGTVVNINGGANINLNSGQFHEVNLPNASFITGNNPISVAQYSQGTSCDGVTSDPFMIMLSPIEQTLEHIVFQAFNTPAINQFYTNIVAKTASTAQVQLDGAALTGWAAVPSNNTYSFVRKNLAQGTHVLTSPDGVLASVYGFGDVESYGYLAGANIIPLNVSFDIILEGIPTAFDVFQDTLMCSQTTVNFNSTTENISDIEWDYGDGSPIFVGNPTPNHEYPAVTADYTVTMYFMREGSCVQEHISMPLHVNSNLPPITNLNDSIVCNGDPYTITLSVPGVTYHWNDNSTSNSYTFSHSGTYSVTVTDAVGCSASSSCNINFVNLSVNVMSQNVSCNGTTDGEMTANVIGGAQPFQYVWDTDPVETTQTITDLLAGNYSVTVTENFGCTSSASGIVLNPPDLNINVNNIQGILCFGDNNGRADVNVIGGTQPYTITWDPDHLTGFSHNNLSAGIYNLTVSDANGCSGSANFTINDAPPLSIDASTQDVDCYGNYTGRINLQANGGTPPLLYNWSNGQMVSSLTNILAGNYVITITDYNNCTISQEFNITQPDELEVFVHSSNIACYGDNNGSILLNLTGGTYPYSFNWSNGQTSQNINNLVFGTYVVTVSDSHACSTFAYAILEQPQLPLHGTITGTNVRCFGEGNGIADLNVVGGTEPYYYIWSTGEISQDLENLIPGNYFVTIFDDHNCTYVDSIQIIQPTAPLGGTISGTNVTCNGGSNGNIYISAFGGRPPYHFEWSNGSWQQNLIEVSAGIYSVTISDQSGCHYIMEYEITEPAPFYLQIMDNPTICYGMITEIGIGIIEGGTEPYTVSWSNYGSGMTTFVNPLETTTYTAHVTDAGFCVSQDFEITVYVREPLNLEVSVSNDSVCPGTEITCIVNVSGGGLTNNNIVWVNDSLMSNPIKLTVYNDTIFRFRIKDVCDFAELTKDIKIYTFPLPPINPVADKYNGCAPLEVYFSETSPDLGQRYIWNFDDGDFENLSFAKNPNHIFYNDRTYNVNLLVISKHGCVRDTTIGIVAFPRPKVDFRADREVVTTGFPVVNFTNYSEGGFWYTWSFGDGNQSKDKHPTHAFSAPGTYTVVLQTESLYSCKDTASKIIKVDNELTIYAPTAFTPNYDGLNDVFQVFVANADTNEWYFTVYDRWGEVIFQTENYEQGWDGRFGDKECPPGIYAWYINYKDLYGNIYKESGYFTLIR